MCLPPVTSNTVPVMYDDRSDARKSATLATSAGSPARAIGISASLESQILCGMASVIADRIRPAVQTANGDYRLVFGAIAQLDGRFALDDPKPITNTFTLRKLRPTLSGRVAPDLSQDFVFTSRGRLTASGYDVEIRIPFKSLRFQSSAEQLDR